MQSIRKTTGGLRLGKSRPIVKYTADRKVVKTYPGLRILMKDLTDEKETRVERGLRNGYVSGGYTYQYEDIFILESKFME